MNDFNTDNYEYQQNYLLCDRSELTELVECVSTTGYDLGNDTDDIYDYQNF